ncbi:MAG: phosphonopyruvate decarboxylase [Gammaproteobacteria bacterium]|nr:phosphonopyruvate decarboxylase [Gammaproteobacteria bacterium]MDH5304859.1 phosphonopyruvate decarboxylase [Gammaproteobacteria bacterium]MDH5323190.1 phosphonopyruvate decarboxylase [Gammaproteobacteria bacterium]
MIVAEDFIQAASRHGFDLYSGVPCSFLKPFINRVIDSDKLRYVGAANEGDAVAIAAGAELGGQRSIVMFQNSGLGNAVSPLTSLTHIFRIPVLLIVTLRGEPGRPADEPQHELMGEITTRMLDLMNISWDFFPESDADIESALLKALASMQEHSRPFAFVMRKGSVADAELQAQAVVRPLPRQASSLARKPVAQRGAMLRAVQSASAADDVIIASTGYTGRELYASGDRPNQLYMVGSMGCAISIGLGLALARPERRIVVLDGDGAALMRLGALATVGFERPGNLLHIVLDNGLHESTGGQATVSQSIDFCALAAACGYTQVASVSAPAELAALIARPTRELTFVHVPILPGVPELPRPSITPAAVAARLRAHLLGSRTDSRA